MTKYPIVLVHGTAIREGKFMRAFGRIEKTLKEAGFDAYTSTHDAFGSIENNAEQLKAVIEDILSRTGADKVNIIGHSKGGLDAKYMITKLGMVDKVASLTTLCTPHKGSAIATRLWSLPSFIKRILTFFIDTFYKLIGDKNPDSMKVCEQLKESGESEEESFSDKVYCQSYSTKLKSGKDCILMAVPMYIYTKTDGSENDGVVSEQSARYENYRGECLDDSVSHTQIVDILAKRKNRKKILAFYVKLCKELGEMGY
ncbi:MAG: alpha/beta hydrolase [Clostridia bacterium]|nr:alpha/beta hydrolase [Clostridia bacterium]